MSESERPPRRTEAQSQKESCTAPARQTPPTSQNQSGRVAELRREHPAHQRSRPGDGGEMVSEQDPAARRKIVGAVGLEMGRLWRARR